VDSGLDKMFTDLDYLAECASNIELAQYNGIIRSEHIGGNYEQRAYFCAIPKSRFSCLSEALPLLFIYSLYDFEEWEKENHVLDNLDKTEWRNILRRIWIPEHFTLSKDCTKVEYKITNEDEFRSEWFPIVNEIADTAILSPIQQIVRYGLINAWNFYNYLIETETEYIDFQYWTSA